MKLENSDIEVFVDTEDMLKTIWIKWYINKKTGYIYGYFKNNKKIYLHRYILGITNPKIQVDHIDRVRHNCRKSNLRLATNRQNSGNTKSRKGTSKFKGVSWEKRVQKWRATIFHNYKQIHLGTFTTETEAAKAYNEKAIEIFGEYALLNVVEE